MKTILSITLPHPDRELSPNARLPLSRQGAVVAGYKKANAKKAARRKAWVETKAALTGWREKPTHYHLTWHYKGAKPDADNCLARCKAYLDGACDALGINDRELDCAGIERVHSLTEWGTVTIKFGREEK